MSQQSFRMPSGIRILEVQDDCNPQSFCTVAKWPADEFGDVFGMAWPWSADMFRDFPFGEEFLTTERRRYEVHNPNALWVDWDACFAA